MKSVFLGFGITLCVILSVIIVLTINGRNMRTNELNDALNSSLEETVRNLKDDNTYSINNADEYVADFMEAFLVQINSDSTVTINVLGVDYEKGLLSVEVIESYKHSNGNNGSVSAIRTVIFEQATESSDSVADEQVKITYMLPHNIIYKEFTVKKGSDIIMPQNPSIDGKEFLQWNVNGSTYSLIDRDNHKVKATKNISLVAVFE